MMLRTKAQSLLVFVTFWLSLVCGSQLEKCPSMCSCTRGNTVVACVGKKLRSVPQGIPTTVKELHLENNDLVGIPKGTFSELVNLEYLYMEKNLLRSDQLADGAFAGPRNLRRLYLTQNKLDSLPPGILRDLTNLQRLTLTQNQFKAIPDLGDSCHNLFKLVIDTNQISNATFPSSFQNIAVMTTVVLSNNPIVNLRKHDFQPLLNANIQLIDLTRTQLENVEAEVFSFFPKLKSLKLSYNPKLSPASVRNITVALKSSIHLLKLDLSGSINDALPPDVFKPLSGVPLSILNLKQMSNVGVIENGTFSPLTSLTELDLSSCSKLRVIQDGAFAGMGNSLKRLKLDRNNLDSIPKSLPNSLQNLTLAGNKLEDIGVNDFVGLQNLLELVLSDGSIEHVENNAFDPLTNLRSLDLSNNKLSGTALGNQVLKPLNLLTHLSLRSNSMTQMPTERYLFQSLEHLEVLDMSENSCETLTELIFEPLVSLKYLSLSGNHLGDVLAKDDSKLFQSQTKLTTLKIENNNIYRIPSSLLRNLQSLECLLLANNELSLWGDGLFNHTRELKLVDLSKNKIAVVNMSSVDGLHNHVKLNLSGNPFNCWCNLIWFRNWMTEVMNTSTVELVDPKSYTCLTPKSMEQKPVLEFNPKDINTQCFPPPWMTIIIAAASGSAALMLAAGAVMYRYRWPIRLRMYYLRKSCSSGKRTRDGYTEISEQEDLQYDLLISYGPSERDENWVNDVLVDRIDVDRDGQWKVFFEAKADYNKPFIAQFAELSECSRRIMFVISKEYLRDSRREYEMTLSIAAAESRGAKISDVLILVVLEDEATVKVPTILHPLMRANQQLVWTEDDDAGQQFFWQQLEENIHRNTPSDPGYHGNVQV